MMSIIGGIGFLIIGLWLEMATSWKIETILFFCVILSVAVVSTMLSIHWRPNRRKLGK